MLPGVIRLVLFLSRRSPADATPRPALRPVPLLPKCFQRAASHARRRLAPATVAALAIAGLLYVGLSAGTASAQPIFEGEDGYRLWLKYDEIDSKPLRKSYRKQLTAWRVAGRSPTGEVIRSELKHALKGLLSGVPEARRGVRPGLLLVGTPTTSPVIRRAGLAGPLKKLGNEGYLIRSARFGRSDVTLIAANTDIGALYGTFAFLRLLQTHAPIGDLDLLSAPKVQRRLLNHWDNLDRHIERGYAGASLWDWHKLPDYKYQRYYDYARASASLGLNGAVLTNVNANALAITPPYLEKVKALADLLRPYGIRVYLTIKFSSPQSIGGLSTSDPNHPAVRKWWFSKAAEIYRYIPDFGGFLVKANSEGQPGPGDFGRSHAEGANLLADALRPHGGIVMWRAFVYASEKNEERSKQAYSEFKPLDGQFRNNVLVQSKNGPIDFQPREPFSPLFGATPKTPLMLELMVTQEYMGMSTHFVYQGTLFEEVLTSETYAKGEGSTVAKVVDGSLFGHPISGIAGVANTGTDRNWTGHILLQSNWYAFGRMAWNHELGAKRIAEEWVRMTLSNDAHVVKEVTEMMLASREAAVDYRTPLGLHHLMGTAHHYGPGPWVSDLGRDDWNPTYYHRASASGIGIDRSPSGENAVEQYSSPLRERLAKPETTPEELLLWFHHLPWGYRVRSSGRPLWDELVHRYYRGAEAVKQMARRWDGLEAKLDPLQFRQVQMAFAIQAKEAEWWRDACVLYFQKHSKRPIPKGLKKPNGTLEQYMKLQFPYAPGQGGINWREAK